MTDTIQINGGESPEELAVRHGIASHQRIVTERDEYKNKLETAEQLIAVYKIEIEGLRAQLAVESTRIVSYQNERDEKVKQHAEDAVLIDIIDDAIKTRKARRDATP